MRRGIRQNLGRRDAFRAFVVLGAVTALLAQTVSGPPKGTGPYRESVLVELIVLDPTIKLDIRYASTHNFIGKAVYPRARAFLQRPAAEALVAAHRWLRERGYGLLVYDGYRPWSVTKLFWDIAPDKRAILADPAVGSNHNRGCAVDVGLYDLRSGRQVEMPSGYDEITERSFVTYQGGTAKERSHRDLLRTAMERDGYFFVLPEEWWHYDFKDYREYAIQDVPFSAILVAEKVGATAASGKRSPLRSRSTRPASLPLFFNLSMT
jgi:zinc D-Ala-D-Ala dipeptidase